MHLRTIALLLCCAAFPALAGCALFQGDATPPERGSRPGAAVALTRHNPVSIHNYKTARDYAAQGRYELAREHYLLAYAAAGDDVVLRDALTRELEAVDMMLHTLR